MLSNTVILRYVIYFIYFFRLMYFQYQYIIIYEFRYGYYNKLFIRNYDIWPGFLNGRINIAKLTVLIFLNLLLVAMLGSGPIRTYRKTHEICPPIPPVHWFPLKFIVVIRQSPAIIGLKYCEIHFPANSSDENR